MFARHQVGGQSSSQMSGDCRPARFKCHEKDAADETSCHASSRIYLYCGIYFGSRGGVRCGPPLSENNKSAHSWASSGLLLNCTLDWLACFLTNCSPSAFILLYFPIKTSSFWKVSPCDVTKRSGVLQRIGDGTSRQSGAQPTASFFFSSATHLVQLSAAWSQVTSTGAMKI